jgi:hypothetical protein
MGTCRGKDAKHRVSTGKIIPTIGKCFCIMGGRMPFAPTIILKIQKIRDSETWMEGYITWEWLHSLLVPGYVRFC